MTDDTKKLINESVSQIIEKSKNKIDSLIDKHDKKIHFIPSKYRVLGGLLQSMNIQFGNFIEILIQNLLKNDGRYEVIEKFSGKKYNNFKILKEKETLIDEYITKCQTSSDGYDLEIEFNKLKENIFLNHKKQNKKNKLIKIKHDIDLLFKDTENNKIYYAEIKYNDDHDTGKFVDINRKLIKTYAYLLSEFNIDSSEDIIPILFFFNNKKMKGNIYLPEKTNIYRGEKFFNKFLNVKYKEIDDYLSNLSESYEIIEMFNNLYKNVMKIK
ncbi:restriction endonuclease [Mycoplasma sp. CSL7475-4]|uniref:HinfI family type II restriction enzyme n=1 Tax=Mycoplasma sp. CSL7475-4 TaxID=2973942 RepID=UPI00216B6154|nr:restriction endonuclease [Mycoplasma sp. CSL7475-4]MCS4537060.1 restriction endonuclease [Mycoplasma sp. CSL7475-4]